MTNPDPQAICVRVGAWLDEGAHTTAADAPRLQAHVTDCADCTAAWEATRALHAWMQREVAVPPRFTDAVMARIAVETLTAPAAVVEPGAGVPWQAGWKSPEVAGGFLAGLVVAGLLPVLASGRLGESGGAVASLLAQAQAAGGALAARPAVLAGLVAAGAILAIPVARAGYRWAAGRRS